MFRPFLTLTSTYLRRSIPLSLPTFAMMIGGPWFVLWLIRFKSGVAYFQASDWHEIQNSSPQTSMFMSFVGILFLSAGASAWAGLPDVVMKAKMTLLPASNRMLGTFVAVVPAIFLMVCNAIVQNIYAALFQNQWPILTTTVCFGAFAMLVMALGWWARDFYYFKIPVVVGVVGTWGYWFVQHFFPDGLRGIVVPWHVFSGGDVAVLILTAIGSWMLTIAAFGKHRCGEAKLGALVQLMNRSPHALFTEREQPIVPLPQTNSAFHCLLEMEWTKGKPIALGTAGITSILLFLGTLLMLNGRRNTLEGMTAMLIINATVCGMLLGITLGVDVWAKSTGNMKQFYAALPLTDADLARGYLQTTVRCVLWSLPVLLIAFVLAIVVSHLFMGPVNLFGILADSRMATRFSKDGFLGVGMLWLSIPLVAWTASGLFMSVTATGRQWVQMVATIIPMGLAFVALVLPIFFGAWGHSVSMGIGLVSLPGIALVGTTVLFVMAVRRGLIQRNSAAICAVIAAALMLTIGVLSPVDVYRTLIFCSIGCLVVTPIAALPLAVASNRHR